MPDNTVHHFSFVPSTPPLVVVDGRRTTVDIPDEIPFRCVVDPARVSEGWDVAGGSLLDLVRPEISRTGGSSSLGSAFAFPFRWTRIGTTA